MLALTGFGLAVQPNGNAFFEARVQAVEPHGRD
jgi:hypothetical protein